MADLTKVTISTIRNMDWASTHGQMAVSMMACGLRESSTERESTQARMEKSNSEFGIKANEPSGSKRQRANGRNELLAFETARMSDLMLELIGIVMSTV